MRLLVIQPRVIFPINEGARLYSANLWRQVARAHDITMLVPHCTMDAAKDAEKMSELCSHCIAVPWSELPAHGWRFSLGLFRASFSELPFTVLKYQNRTLIAQAEKLLKEQEFDALVADRLPSMVNVPAQTPCPVVFIDHNVESLVFARFAQVERRPLARWYLEMQARRLKRFERAACERADLCIALSDVDLRTLREQGGVRRGAVVPPGVDLDFFQPVDKPPRPHSIVFSGSMDSWQNVNCAQWFAFEVLPLIQKELPDASFTIVGRNPRPAVRTLEQRCQNVRVTGSVDDVRPHIAEAEVFVIPLRFGSGVRLKLFEALAMRKAVVSTTIGAEGSPFRHDEHLLLADEPADMAAAIVKLMREPEYRQRLERSGHEYVLKHCGWKQIATHFEQILWELLESCRLERH